MKDDQATWPQTCLYDQLNAAIPHAVGVLSINFGFVESILEELIGLYLNLDEGTSNLITTTLGNDSRVGLLKSLAALKESDNDYSWCIQHYATCFMAAKDARNKIIHSICFPGPTSAIFVRRTATKCFRRQDLHTDRIKLSSLADEVRGVFHFGANLVACITYRKDRTHVALPGACAVPSAVTFVERI